MQPKIRQKDIVFVDLNPTQGREQKGKRPAVVVSGNAFHFSDVCLVCPLTSKIKNYAGNVFLEPNKLNGLEEKSEILVGQVRVVSLGRIKKKVGVIKDSDLQKIFEGLDLLLDR